jgi:hypothetical protein
MNLQMKHVDSMNADMGGTEIGLALQSVFDNRDKATPAVLFLLTDGEVSHFSSLKLL